MQFLNSVINYIIIYKSSMYFCSDQLNTTSAADLSMGETESNSEHIETEAIESMQILLNMKACYLMHCTFS